MHSKSRRAADSIIGLPCYCASLRRATRIVTQIYDDLMRPTGLRITQLTLLQAIEELEETTPTQLGRLLAIDGTTLSRSLRPLETGGWILATPGTDRRANVLKLSPAGDQLMKQARPLWEAAQKRVRQRLGKKRSAELLDMLDRTSGILQLSDTETDG